MKTKNVLASEQETNSDLFFSTAQSTTFIFWKQYRRTSQTDSQTETYAQVTSSSNIFGKINSEIKLIDNYQLTDFQKMFDGFIQNDEIIEPYQVNNFDLSKKGLLKEVVH